MGASFRTGKSISETELFDGRLEKFGVREPMTKSEFPEVRYLEDGENTLLVYLNKHHLVSCFECRAWVDPNKILSAIAEAFDVDIFDENQPQYWGFETEEERYLDSCLAREAFNDDERSDD